jgi:hypothetical protein
MLPVADLPMDELNHPIPAKSGIGTISPRKKVHIYRMRDQEYVPRINLNAISSAANSRTTTPRLDQIQPRDVSVLMNFAQQAQEEARILPPMNDDREEDKDDSQLTISDEFKPPPSPARSFVAEAPSPRLKKSLIHSLRHRPVKCVKVTGISGQSFVKRPDAFDEEDTMSS